MYSSGVLSIPLMTDIMPISRAWAYLVKYPQLAGSGCGADGMPSQPKVDVMINSLVDMLVLIRKIGSEAASQVTYHKRSLDFRPMLSRTPLRIRRQ